MMMSIEHFFVLIGNSYTFHFEFSLHMFYPFGGGVIVFLLLNCRNALCILDILSVSDTYIY